MKTKNDSNFSGMLGESATVRKVRGQLVVKNKPRRQLGRAGAPPKDPGKLEAARARFLEASQYARQQTSVSQSADLYAKGITDRKRTAYLVAMVDYMIAPKVHSIDTLGYRGSIGDLISVKATDDFMVTNVKVVITDSSGALIEEGDAGPDALRVNLWAYKASAANATLPGTKIQAVAYDRPGNTGTAEIVL